MDQSLEEELDLNQAGPPRFLVSSAPSQEQLGLEQVSRRDVRTTFFPSQFRPRAAGVAMERKVSPSVKRCMAMEAPAGCHATLPLPQRLCPPVPMVRERSRGVKLSMSPCMFNASIRISTLRKMSGLCFCAASLRINRYFPQRRAELGAMFFNILPDQPRVKPLEPFRA